MEVVSNNYMPGDSRLVQQIVYELKSQGIFDQFRKECIADVDTKPAYQNLRQRVEGSVSSFLNEKIWSPDMNKNQVREQLRKSIHESGYLDIGVERIVDQVVNPKINSVFLPQVEDVVYRYLGVQKPIREIKKGLKIDIEDLLPTDLEAVSPESVHSDKNDCKMEDISELDNSLNKQIDDDESPPFEPLDNEPTLATTLEENSVDSHLSGISGLQSHDNSNQESDTKICQMDISSQDSQTSQNSSESHLSIVTSDETIMEVGDDSRSKLMKSKETELKASHNMQVPYNELTPDNMQTADNMQIVDNSHTLNCIQFSEEIQIDNKPSELLKKNETVKNIDNTIKYISEKKSDKKLHSRKSDEKKIDDKKSSDKKYESKKSDKHTDERRSDEKKSEKRDDKKSKSSDKYTSKDKKDDKYKKSSSKSKDREKSNSRHNSSSSKEKSSSTKDKDSSSLIKEKESSKEKTKIKEKKDYRSSSSTKEKGDRERNKDKNDKDKSDKDKNKFDKPRGRSDKDKERSDQDKDKYEKKKDKPDKDKNKTSSSSGNKSSSSSSKDRSSSSSKKDKYRSSGSDSKDKLKTNSDSKSSRSEIRSKSGDSKTSSTDVKSGNVESRSKSSENSKTEEKQSLTSSSSKKSKKRDSKKQTKDDHYSSKDKKSDRRSTDRDSNDGQSNKQSHSNSLSENTSSSSQKQSNESSSISGSGTNDSGNSDRVEHVKMTESPTNNNNIQKLKYVKPKLASNFQEAIKIMKIRKQLAKLERKNQLSLARIDLLNPVPNGVATDKPIVKENYYTQYSDKVDNIDHVETVIEEPKSTVIEESTPIRVITPLKTTDLSKENWEALEARLAQEMSNVNYSSYESYDDYDYSGCEVIISPKKNADTSIERLIVEETTSSNNYFVSKLEDKLEESLETEHESESKNNETPNIEITKIDDTETDGSVQICNKNHNINNIKCDEIRIESNDIKIPSPYILHNTEKSNGTHPKVHEIEEIGLVECIIPNEVEEETITSSNLLETEIPLGIQDIDEYISSDSMCRYLEKPSPSVQRNLQFIYQFVKKLESDVEHCIKASQNNFLPIKRGKKRKSELYVDMKNNNNAFFEEITEVKKRGRPSGLHSNTSISKANRDKSRNSTDISPNERFSLPLSPAESDKSTDKKEDIKPEKQKTNQVKTPRPKRQRYSSEDLYKPRPVIGRGRRGRCAKPSD